MPSSVAMTVVRALRLLEIERGASLDAMRQSYRDLVRVWHPDRFEADARLRAKAAARLSEINEAYRLLQSTGTELAPAARPAPSSMPDRRKQPRTAPAARAAASPRSHMWGYAVVGAILVVVMGLIGMPRIAREPAATPRAVVTGPRTPSLTASLPTAPTAPRRAAIAPVVTNPAPAPPVPAKSPFSRDLDRVLASTQSSVR